MSSPRESRSLVRTPQDHAVNPLDHPLSSDSHSPKTPTVESPDMTPLDLDRDHDGPDDLPSPRPSAAKAVGISVYRRRTKRKKAGFHKRRAAQEKKSMKKLEVLIETLKPIPFAPGKLLDFSSHEKLLNRLGLWDFVHIEFDREIRSDLLAQLIANFSHLHRGSYVNGVKVMVNRADLARALKLPVKKPVAVLESADAEEGPAATEELIGFILDLVSNWVLLHDDTWMMPNEVLNWMKVIKDGNLEKVDWAGMVWFMVEKELLLAPQLVDCYYASHLQHLIKSQKEELLLPSEEGAEEEPKIEVDVKDKEDELVEEADVGGDVKMNEVDDNADARTDDADELGFCGSCDLEEFDAELSLGGQGNALVEHSVELSLGVEDKTIGEAVEKVDEDMVVKAYEDRIGKEDEGEGKEAEKEQVGDENLMDFKGCKEENNDHDQWPFEKNDVGDESIFLRQCSFGVELNNVMGFEDDRKQEGEDGERVEEEEEEEEEERDDVEEEEEDEEEMVEEHEEDQGEQDGGFNLSPKGLGLDGFPSGALLHSLDAVHMNLSSGMPLRDPLAGDFLSSRNDACMPSLFVNGGTSKREINHEDDNTNHSVNSNKRLRIDGTWENGKSSCDFETCMEQIQFIAGKARMLHTAKEQEATMNQQILMTEMQRRDDMIEHLHKVRLEEQKRKELEVYRLDRELHMMNDLLQSYRNALRETQKAFAEYRARYPQPHDPLYKDVAGSAGLVISAMELEKQRLKQEEGDRVTRLAVETEIKDFEVWWDVKFTEFGNNVDVVANELVSLEEEMKLLKESYAKHKRSKPPESAEIDS